MKNIHEVVTKKLIEAMSQAEDFEMPWHSQSAVPINALTTRPYNGINIVSLWAAATEQSYSSNQWATYKQWQSMGGQVNKGESGSCIVIYKPLPVDEDEEPRCLLRSATVFNAEQVSGVAYSPGLLGHADETDRLCVADRFISNVDVQIEYRGDRAFYSPGKDMVVVPPREKFKGTATSSPTEAFYSTLFHELTHSTGHAGRCGRDLTARFGSSGYAMEELIAELGAAFLCAELKVSAAPRQDHANYLANWLTVLESDSKAIFWASARASEAVAYLNSLQPK